MRRERSWCPPRVTRFVLGEDEFAVLSFSTETAPLPEVLAPAERDVFRLMLEGLSNAEIARVRGTKLRTVANQVASIFDKLGIGSRFELWTRFGAPR